MRWSLHALLFGLLTLGSVFVLLSGELLVGIAGIILFGLGGAAYLYQSFPWGSALPAPGGNRDRGRPVQGTLSGAHRYTPYTSGLVFPARRRSVLLPLAASLLFVVLGVLMLLVVGTWEPADYRGTRVGPVGLTVAGVLSIAFFGGFAVMFVGTLIRPGGIALLPEGVYLLNPAGRAWVRWDDLHRAFLSAQGGFGSYVGLQARSPDAITLTGLNRWAHGINRRRYRMDAGYSAERLGGDGRELLACLEHHVRSPEARPRLADPGYGQG
ncbi:hypothetical protein [Nocardiopsis oceani]